MPTLEFSKGGVLYPFVLAYWIEYHGMVELLGRSWINLPKRLAAAHPGAQAASNQALQNLRRSGRFPAGLLDRLGALSGQSVTPIVLPLLARTSFGGPSVRIESDDLAEEVWRAPDEEFMETWSHRVLAAQLLIAAHEVVKPLGAPKTPELEFLRHCRNASAHGWKFWLKSGEPRRPANWRTFTVDPAWDGRPLMKAAGAGGVLEPGDPLLLVWDVEQQLKAAGLHT